jgi:hypothetical protein
LVVPRLEGFGVATSKQDHHHHQPVQRVVEQ